MRFRVSLSQASREQVTGRHSIVGRDGRERDRLQGSVADADLSSEPQGPAVGERVRV